MLVDLCGKAPSSVCGLSVVGFLLFGCKFTLMSNNISEGYVCPKLDIHSLYVPEDIESINPKLDDLPHVTYKARMIMENSNNITKNS
ncbi:unnamed protein product [Mucor hiemalis]